ncbi:hypothetical protein MJO28_003609 [Puccinia striiformis f. sp. tritici]|uniref:Uncharacterized protein n=1 Tax=Puccinia striiformis f. sp. tritici TaxID=168172 RepID=A0ACC0EM38_9BASI|nr:hypothetical protein MJO28_003609 [Puccinia striiformis f. sp. tritici]
MNSQNQVASTNSSQPDRMLQLIEACHRLPTWGKVQAAASLRPIEVRFVASKIRSPRLRLL